MDIVVVASGPHARLRRCLQSLQAHPPTCADDVTVVDEDVKFVGASPHGTKPEVRQW